MTDDTKLNPHFQFIWDVLNAQKNILNIVSNDPHGFATPDDMMDTIINIDGHAVVTKHATVSWFKRLRAVVERDMEGATLDSVLLFLNRIEDSPMHSNPQLRFEECFVKAMPDNNQVGRVMRPAEEIDMKTYPEVWLNRLMYNEDFAEHLLDELSDHDHQSGLQGEATDFAKVVNDVIALFWGIEQPEDVA